MKTILATAILSLALIAPAAHAKEHGHSAPAPRVQSDAQLFIEGGDALRADFDAPMPISIALAASTTSAAATHASSSSATSTSSSTAPSAASPASSSDESASPASSSAPTSSAQPNGAEAATGTSAVTASSSLVTSTASSTPAGAAAPGAPAAPSSAGSIYALSHRFSTQTTRFLLGLAIALGAAGYLMTEAPRVRFALRRVWG